MLSEGLGRKDHHTILHGPSKGSFALSLFPVQLQNVKNDVALFVKQEARPVGLELMGFRKTVKAFDRTELQPFQQTMTGRSKFPKCTGDAYRMQSRQPFLHSNLDIF